MLMCRISDAGTFRFIVSVLQRPSIRSGRENFTAEIDWRLFACFTQKRSSESIDWHFLTAVFII